MGKQIIFIDYENVQNFDLSSIVGSDVLVKVFHGENQKFTGEFIDTALQLGKKHIELIEINGNGKNALDFHIAYYIGKIAGEISNAVFTVISKDNGFIPLINHLNQKERILVSLRASIAEVKIDKKTKTPAQEDIYYKLVLKKLALSKITKPKKKLALRNQIISLCKKKVSETEADEIIEKLINSNFISCTGESITYNQV